MSPRVPPGVRLLLAVGARLAPRSRRAAWRRQWVAEVEHRLAEGRGGLWRFATGSLAHALYLRRAEVTMRGWMADLRQSARALSRRPGFTLLTVTTLAIGIGAATAIFSLAEALLLRPLPLEESDRLVGIFSSNPARGNSRFSVSYPDYVDFTSRSDLFETSSLYIEQSRDVAGGAEPERVRAAAVHEGFFQALRSPTALGRLFASDDHDPRSGATAVLSTSFWASRFGSDSTVVGSTIRLDGVPHTVVGIVSDEHAWPRGVRVWTPLQWGGVAPDFADARSNHTWQVVARLRGDVDVGRAHEQVRSMARAIYARPDIDPRDEGTEALVVPLHSSAGGDGGGALFATLGTSVLLVLLIACMNVSGLLLTRAWSRGRELSLRSALGAGRARIVAMLLGESVVLAGIGGALGIALGHAALQRAFALAPPAVTAIGDLRLNGTVVAAGVAISVLAALLAGLLPALRASRVSVAESLKDGSAQAGTGRRGARLRKGLVITEVAFSLALLTGAGMTIRGFQRQLATDPGFEADGLLSFTVRLPATRYGDDALVEAFYGDAIAALTRRSGIVGATSTSTLPLGAGGLSLGRSFVFDGAAPPPEGTAFPATWVEVDPHFFETVGVRMVEGRPFDADDRSEAPPVAIVNARMAAQMSPGASIVGRVIRSHYDENLPRTVVGVIPDLQIGGVSREQRRPVVMVPRAQSVRRSMAFLVRTASDPEPMIPAVREALADLDADVALDHLVPLREAHAADLAGIRFLTTLFATFGALALALAVSGVYGLVSYSASQRTGEFGVRMAMGATRGSVRGAVLRESGLLALAGVSVGLALAYGAGRVLAYGMDGVATLEASTYVVVTLLLAGAMLAASWFPAERATRVDPVRALRSE